MTASINRLELTVLSLLPKIANQIPLSEFRDWLCLDRYGIASEPNTKYIVAALPFLDAEHESIALRDPLLKGKCGFDSHRGYSFDFSLSISTAIQTGW